MPVIKPFLSDRNFTPSSTAAVSASAATIGVAALFHRLHGQVAPPVGGATAALLSAAPWRVTFPEPEAWVQFTLMVCPAEAALQVSAYTPSYWPLPERDELT